MKLLTLSLAATSTLFLAGCMNSQSDTTMMMSGETVMDWGAMMDTMLAWSGEMMASGMVGGDAMVTDDATMSPPSDAMMNNDRMMAPAMEGSMMMSGESMEGGAMMKAETSMTPAPSALKLAEYSPTALANTKGKEAFALYFAADWCPKCRALNTAFKDTPEEFAGVNIIRANYDTELDLKKEYDIRSQHTFVFFDATGNVVKKLTYPKNEDVVAFFR